MAATFTRRRKKLQIWLFHNTYFAGEGTKTSQIWMEQRIEEWVEISCAGALVNVDGFIRYSSIPKGNFSHSSI
jgi:hypothetical protein